jgi:citrate synthase
MTNKKRARVETKLCSYTPDAVYYRDRDLVRDLLGKSRFIDVFIAQTLQRTLSDAESQLIDAILIVLMEHGMTPSSIAARLVYCSSPESLQAAVAAGLLAVGSQFVGTIEQAAEVISGIVADADQRAAVTRIVADFARRGLPLPGFGHHLHTPDDPRSKALLELASRHQVAGLHCEALLHLGRELDRVAGHHITINATGAVASILCDMGIPVRIMRGFALLSRAAGLISHLAEEQERPAGRYIWDVVDRAMAADTKG